MAARVLLEHFDPDELYEAMWERGTRNAFPCATRGEHGQR